MIEDFFTWLLKLDANSWAIFATWAGTIISAFSLIGIYRLSRLHQAKTRLPSLLEDLKKEVQILSQLLINKDDFPSRVSTFHLTSKTVRSLVKNVTEKQVPKSLRTDALKLLKQIDNVKLKNLNHETAFDIFVASRGIETTLGQTIKDMEA